MSSNNNFFDNVEKNTKVNKEDIFKLAASVQNSNLKDEQVLRQLVQQVGVLAGRTVTKEKEDQIVKAIMNNNLPTDLNALGNMFKK
ncbi:stage VI sporulation protein F [Ectobacillus polymachus]|uniref:stage VI sporulation protein F n=1 Tax=Ectobacillus polymachus TaxID=1508806 RepID=UPI003A83B3EB